MHRSTRLRDAARTVLEQAGFAVLATGELPLVYEVVWAATTTPVLALVEHEMGEAMTPWGHVLGTFPRGTVVFGLVETVGPRDTLEATIVTRGEREVHGPMPIADLPQALNWVVPTRRARRGGHHL